MLCPSPSAVPAPDDQEQVAAIDVLFEQAGLVRNRRGSTPGIMYRVRFERAAQEELSKVAPAPRVAANGVEWIAVPGWAKTSWLWHGFSTRSGGVSRPYCANGAPGDLNLGFTDADDRGAVIRNREKLAEAVTGNAGTPLVTIRQFHSTVIVLARSTDAARERPLKADGLMTREPGMLLGVQTADCVPVLVADLKRRAVAAFHAGWRGTVNRIVESGIGVMRLEFGSQPEDLVAAIGPGIGACCYSVGDEVLSSFESQFSYFNELFREVYDADPVRTRYPMLFLTQRAPGHSSIGPSLHLNLIEANRRQLMAAGLSSNSIKVIGGCTSCQPQMFFSHRASQGHAGRMLGVIGIRDRAKSKSKR